MTHLAPNGARALTGGIALFFMCMGASMLWGLGAGLLSAGLFIAIDCSVDEIVERVTKTTRYRSPQEGAVPHD